MSPSSPSTARRTGRRRSRPRRPARRGRVRAERRPARRRRPSSSRARTVERGSAAGRPGAAPPRAPVEGVGALVEVTRRLLGAPRRAVGDHEHDAARAGPRPCSGPGVADELAGDPEALRACHVHRDRRRRPDEPRHRAAQAARSSATGSSIAAYSGRQRERAGHHHARRVMPAPGSPARAAGGRRSTTPCRRPAGSRPPRARGRSGRRRARRPRSRPASRSAARRPAGRGVSPTKSLLDSETSTGQPVATISPSRRVTSREWKVFLPKSWAGSMTTLAGSTPAATARSAYAVGVGDRGGDHVVVLDPVRAGPRRAPRRCACRRSRRRARRPRRPARGRRRPRRR